LSKDTDPKHGDKTNIVCWKCGIKGHYSNECPTKLNAAPKPPVAQDPVITKESVKPSCSEDPKNVLSSSGGNPINTNLGMVRNRIIIEDSVKVSIASTSAGEGSSLAEHQEVTSPTQRHEEKKKRSIIGNQPPSKHEVS
jgi:hypothetical protein